jgi:hypothetical protein
MRKPAITILLCLWVVIIFSQQPAAEKGSNATLARLDTLRRSIDSALNLRTLDGLLAKKFPESSRVDGRWVYYSDQADIQRLEMPHIRTVLQEYSFYTVTLTNYLGYHVNRSRNLILFDSVHLWTIHAVPMWYSDISKDLLSLFIGKSFPDSTALLEFTGDLQRLMNTGSTGSFENTVYHKDKVTFDLTYQGANRKAVWRHIEMYIDNNTIRRFRSIKPAMNGWVVVE